LITPSSRSRLSYKDRRSHQKKRFRFVGVVILLIALYQVFALFVAEPWVLETNAMIPGNPPGTRILVSPYLLRHADEGLRHPPRRGDLISIQPPYVVEASWHFKILNPIVRILTFQRVTVGPTLKKDWENERIFKRVVALPGDTVKLDGYVAYVKGREDEYFISEFEMSGKGYDLQIPDLPEGWEKDMALSGFMNPMTLNDGEYFVMGDNRAASSDSRHWGAIEEKAIRGRVFFRYWPLRSIGFPQ
jgi:signal peptidase I